MGKTGKLFKDLEEPSKGSGKQDFRVEIAQDFERLKAESKAYFFLMKRITDMQSVAMYHVMALGEDKVGNYWRGQLHAIDGVLGIPDEFAQKGREAESEKEIRSIL
jgi:hypothetical protein